MENHLPNEAGKRGWGIYAKSVVVESRMPVEALGKEVGEFMPEEALVWKKRKKRLGNLCQMSCGGGPGNRGAVRK